MIFKHSVKLVKRVIPLFIIASLFSACGDGGSNQIEQHTATTESEAEEVNKEEESVYYMLPSALQIAHIFRKSGLKFYPNVINDSKNLNKYVSQTSKLQNLGVYSADLCYSALNRQSQEELSCLKAMMSLSNEMGFSSVFSGAFVDRFEKNISNEDSMIVILAQLQERLDYYLQDAEMEDQSTIIFSGAWIESLYLSLSGFRLDGDESALTVRVSEQLNILKSLIAKLEYVYEPVDDVKVLIEDLKGLLATIEGFEFMNEFDLKKRTSVSNVSISTEELQALMDKVDSMRSKIVNT